ncbi:MAG: maleate cis-trans isomerase family protein [Acidimicrobiia bacterium]
MTQPLIGLIALNRDQVVEEDMHTLLGSTGTVLTTRIPLESVGSVAALGALEKHLAAASALLPAGPDDVVAFACTSGVAVIGSDTIEQRVTEGRPGARVANPLEGIRLGMEALSAKRAALVTPYGPEVTGRIVEWLEEHGITIIAETRLDGPYRHYADIPPHTIGEVAIEMGHGAEAILIACTDLRAISVIDEVEAAIGIPVLTSNQALAWSICRELDIPSPGPGRLFRSR